MKVLLFLAFVLSGFYATAQTIDVEGHRGCRGLMPENTISAFIKAIDLGVTTLEMDVVISKDKKVLLSHEPFLSYEICSGPNGEAVDALHERHFNLYQMNYEEIRRCDCGAAGHPRFPKQEHVPSFKPLLEEVIDTVERYISYKNLKPVQYNIEIKSSEESDILYHPVPSVFTELVYEVISRKQIQSRVILQSFDPRVLNDIHAKQLPVRTSFLVENVRTFEKNMALL